MSNFSAIHLFVGDFSHAETPASAASEWCTTCHTILLAGCFAPRSETTMIFRGRCCFSTRPCPYSSPRLHSSSEGTGEEKRHQARSKHLVSPHPPIVPTAQYRGISPAKDLNYRRAEGKVSSKSALNQNVHFNARNRRRMHMYLDHFMFFDSATIHFGERSVAGSSNGKNL